MKRLSSSFTFFYKRVFPTIWFGFLGLFFVIGVCVAVAQPNKPDWIAFVAGPPAMALFGFVFFKCFIFGLVDEVWWDEDADELIVKDRGEKHVIALRDCHDVDYNGFFNPPRVTVLLSAPSLLGTKFHFMPPPRLFQYSTPPLIHDLRQRMRTANDRSRTNS